MGKDSESRLSLERGELLARFRISQERGLFEGTKHALTAKTFRERNATMSRTVADVSAPLAAQALSTDPQQHTARLAEVFRRVALEVGSAFEPYLDQQGQPRKEKIKENYFSEEGPMHQGREIAFRHLQAAVEAVGIKGYDQDRLEGLVQKLRQHFPHAVEITHETLGLPPPPQLDETTVKKNLRRRLPLKSSPQYEAAIDELPFCDSPPLTNEELRIAGMFVRLSQAAWLRQQPERSICEDTPERVDPKHRQIYLPFDSVLFRNFERYQAKNGKDASSATSIVETWKDIKDSSAVRRPKPKK